MVLPRGRRGPKVTASREMVAAARGLPLAITVDNGAGVCSRVLDGTAGSVGPRTEPAAASQAAPAPVARGAPGIQQRARTHARGDGRRPFAERGRFRALTFLRPFLPVLIHFHLHSHSLPRHRFTAGVASSLSPSLPDAVHP